MSLTPKQRDLMLYIQRYIDANGGVSPSYDEMTEAMGLSSKSGIHRMVEGLIERGFIAKLRARARSIELKRRIFDPEAATLSDDGRDAFKALVREIAHGPLSFEQQDKARALLRRYG